MCRFRSIWSHVVIVRSRVKVRPHGMLWGCTHELRLGLWVGVGQMFYLLLLDFLICMYVRRGIGYRRSLDVTTT